jgi:hypothetical protein
MDLLLVNPPETAIGYIFSLLEQEVDLTVVITHQRWNNPMLDRDLIKVIDLESTVWDRDIKIASAISWNKAGQDLLDSISEQILLNNPKETVSARTALYLKPDIEVGTFMIDTLSYKGRHLLCSVMIKGEEMMRFAVGKFQDTDDFKNNIETAFQLLDSTGIINGPCRIFIKDSKPVALKPSLPDRPFMENKTTRRFLDIWPKVIKLETENAKKAHLAFYDWAEQHGSAKKFSLIQ